MKITTEDLKEYKKDILKITAGEEFEKSESFKLINFYMGIIKHMEELNGCASDFFTCYDKLMYILTDNKTGGTR